MTAEMQYPIDLALQQHEGFSLKEALGYTLVTGLAVGGAIYFIAKAHKHHVADTADAQSFSTGSAATVAKQIHMALHNNGKIGGNTAELRRIIGDIKSKDDMDQIARKFEDQYGKPLYRSMEDTLQDSEYNEMLAIKEAKPQKAGQKVDGQVIYDSWAKRFKAAFDLKYLWFDALDVDAILFAINEIPTRRAFVNTAVSFQKQKFGDLMATLKARLDSSEYYNIMKQITVKPQA